MDILKQLGVEENNFGIRKRLLEYDDVMNVQREAIYERRKNALDVNKLKIDVADMIYDTIAKIYDNAKVDNDFKAFEFEIIKCFSTTSPVNLSKITSWGAVRYALPPNDTLTSTIVE